MSVRFERIDHYQLQAMVPGNEITESGVAFGQHWESIKLGSYELILIVPKDRDFIDHCWRARCDHDFMRGWAWKRFVAELGPSDLLTIGPGFFTAGYKQGQSKRSEEIMNLLRS